MTEASPTRSTRNLLQRVEDLRRVLETAPAGFFSLALEGRVVLGKGTGGQLVDEPCEGRPAASR